MSVRRPPPSPPPPPPPAHDVPQDLLPEEVGGGGDEAEDGEEGQGVDHQGAARVRVGVDDSGVTERRGERRGEGKERIGRRAFYGR